MKRPLIGFVLSLFIVRGAALASRALPALAVEPHGDVNAVEVGKENGHSTWVLKANADAARLKVKVACSPTKPTYLSLRYPGDGGGQVIFGCNEKGEGFPPFDLLDEGGLWHVNGGGTFIQTIEIPQHLTKGKKTATIYIGASGVPSRKILRIYSHIGPLMEPMPAEDKTAAKPYKFPRFKPISKVAAQKAKKRLAEVVGEQCDTILWRQLWAPNWKDLVAKGEWPADMVGGFDANVLRDGQGKIDIWATKNRFTAHYTKYNNNGPFLFGTVMAFAYATPGSKYYKNPEILERIAYFLDFCRRAQAMNGPYWTAWGWPKDRWVGGPNRVWASGTPLEGAGDRGIGHAFVIVGKAMAEAGLLDVKVDDDCNPDTPERPRREVYQDLFKLGMDYMMGRGGHAPNQECYQLDALFMYYKALKRLGVDPKTFDTIKDLPNRTRRAVGDVKPGEWTWVGYRGVPIEHGGYSIEYNRGQEDMYYRFAMQGGKDYEFCRKRADVTGTALGTLIFPCFSPDKRYLGWAAPSFLNHRHRNILRGDGYGPNFYLAYFENNPIHIRMYQLQNMYFNENSINFGPARKGNWFPTDAYNVATGSRLAAKVLEELSNPKSPFCDDVHFPMESGQPDFYWGDESCHILCFKDGEKRVFMTLNQFHRMGLVYADIQVNGMRQFLRGRCENLTKNKDGNPEYWGVSTLVLGDWFIAVNGHPHERLFAPIPADFRQNAIIHDLQTKQRVRSTRLSMKPFSTIVLKRTRSSK